MKNDKIIIANKKFNSRLIVGTGKYKNMTECAKAIKLSGAEIVTVAVIPNGEDEEQNLEIFSWGTPKKLDNAKEHFEIPAAIHGMDFEMLPGIVYLFWYAPRKNFLILFFVFTIWDILIEYIRQRH